MQCAVQVSGRNRAERWSWNAGIALAAGLCVAGGVARAQGVYASGFLHSPGNSDTTVSASGRSVLGSASSGACAVVVACDTSVGAGFTLDTGPLFAPGIPMGSSYRTTYRGWDGTVKGRVTMTSVSAQPQDYVLACDADFAASGVSELHLVCITTDGTQIVLGGGPGGGPRVGWKVRQREARARMSSQNNLRTGSSGPEFSVSYDSGAVIVEFETSSGVLETIPNVVQVVCRPICIVAPCPPDTWTTLGVIEVSSDGVTQFPLSDTEYVVPLDSAVPCCSGGGPRVDIWSSEGSSVSEVDGPDFDGDGAADRVYRCAALPGSSSKQVTVDVHAPAGAGLSFRKKQYVGHVTLMRFTDEDERQIRVTTQGQETPGLPGLSSVRYTPDMSGLGAQGTLVSCFDEAGQLLASHELAPGQHFSIATTDATTKPRIRLTTGTGLNFRSCDLQANPGDVLSLDWSFGIPPAGVHRVSMSPLNPTVTMGSPALLEISSGDGDDIIVGDFQIIAPPTGPACDSIDFNADGIENDPTDIEAFLSVYSGGPCIPIENTCNDIDFNNDGIEQDPLDIESFLSLYSGGPCL